MTDYLQHSTLVFMEEIIKLPKISVVTPVFNGEKFIEKTITSILNQNYPNLEYIVIDGGSTDNTLNIINKYKDKLSYFISEPDKGMYDALNKGFSMATGDILCWLNSDDEYYPHTLATVAKLFTDLPDVEWIEGANSFLNEDEILVDLKKPRILSKFNFLNYDYQWIQQESTFWRKGLMDKISENGDMPFDISIKYAGDFHLWFKFFQYSKLCYTDVPLGKFRIRKNQLSEKFIDIYHQEAFSVIKGYKIPRKEKIKFCFEKIKFFIIRIMRSICIFNTDGFDKYIFHRYAPLIILYNRERNQFFRERAR